MCEEGQMGQTYSFKVVKKWECHVTVVNSTDTFDSYSKNNVINFIKGIGTMYGEGC